jgi:hypothetical protein
MLYFNILTGANLTSTPEKLESLPFWNGPSYRIKIMARSPPMA